MAVHLVYRYPTEGLAGKRILHFDEASILDFFRNRWGPETAELDDSLTEARSESFDPAFPPPTTEEAIWEAFTPGQRDLVDVRAQPGAIELLYMGLEYLATFAFFDDHFVQARGGDVAFLLREDWQLPEESLPGRAEPSTQASFLLFTRPHDPRQAEWPAGEVYRIEGVGLPDLARHLATATPDAWPFELWVLRSQLFADEDAPTAEERAFLAELRERPSEDAGWQMYADWLAERGEVSPGTVLLRRALERVGRLPLRDLEGLANRRGFYAASISAARRDLEEYVFERARHRPFYIPSLSVSSAADHVAQLALHYEHVRSEPLNIFYQWYLFDQQWAAAHPALAMSLQRWIRRWDVLTRNDREPESSAQRQPL